MNKLIVPLILTGLAASVSPVAIVALIDVLTYKNAVKNSLAFLFGFSLTLISVGVAGVFLLGKSYGSALIPAYIKGYLDIALGIMCFGLLIYVLSKPRKSKEGTEDTPQKTMSTGKAFLLGVIFMVSNSSTWVIYISGIHIIVTAKLRLEDDLLSLGLLSFLTLLTVLVPIAMYIVAPKKADELLTALGAWLNKHHKIISTVILGFFGIYLTIRGLSGV